MNDDLTLPDFLRIPQDVRREAWRGRKLTKVKITTKVTRHEDPQTKAFRREMEKKAAAKKAAALQRLRENYSSRPKKR